jgi:hypothetical protein
MDEPRAKRDWVPLLVTLAVNVFAMAVAYGKLDQRVSTLETLRVEARIELQAQLRDIDAKLTVLLGRPLH